MAQYNLDPSDFLPDQILQKLAQPYAHMLLERIEQPDSDQRIRRSQATVLPGVVSRTLVTP